ncbi:MAG TPA: hypothetical protein VM452_13710 [Caulifigura sp.]|jgi:hypothetical protein|nr:hypothetical protein [Caulifigura sp.]
MKTVEDLLADARQLSPAERRRLIVLLQESLTRTEGTEGPPPGWTRDLWEDTPEYRVGAAQAISIAEVKRRIDKQSWFGGLFQ